ncbi:MAG: phosphatase PAP2 family protein [Cardiobacteriaceae bacterium]|nr:phosphatase PAP2 family protein [Cardiobacteriaceae bacterium]
MSPRITFPLLLILLGIQLLAAAALIKHPQTQPLINLAVAAILWLYVIRHRHNHWLGFLTLTLIWMVFPLLKPINTTWLTWHADALLTRIDQTLWGGSILPAYFHYEAHPVLTDILVICYFCFFFIIIGSAAYYTVRRHSQQAHAYYNGLLALYLIGLIGYFALPAAGPAFTTMPDQGTPGLIAPTLIAIIKDGVTGMDVFPSLHTAISLYINLFLWRDGKKCLAIALAPITLGIIAATIYLRYHYGIDVLVGSALALYITYRTAPQLKEFT